jgi:DNA-binding CsgD family transcriptional regulator/tetratricopeptide (TPR) repeat protein
MISGEPGVGKTRLAREILDRHEAEIVSLSAHGYPLATTTAFGMWADGLDPVLRGRSREEVVRLCGGFVDDLAELLHSVAAVRGSGPERAPPRLRLLAGLACVLGNLTRGVPLVVILDDVHLADASSWETLRYLARHPPDRRMLVLAIARPADLAALDLAAQVLFDLDQDGLLTRLELKPLDRQMVGDLAEVVLDRRPPAALVDWLADRSRGNALFTIGLLRALVEEGANLAAPRLDRMPVGLTQRVVSDIRQLAEAERSMLELLAVLGRPIDSGSLVTLSGQQPDELEPILATLVAGGALVNDERGRELTYEIHHPLVRDAIYQAIGRARRRTLHRWLAHGLLRAHHLAEAASHFAKSADIGDKEAIETLCGAMSQAEHREAYRESLELLSALVDLLPAGDERWLEVLEAMLAGAEWVVDHRADVQEATAIKAMRAIDMLLDGSSDAARRATVKFRLANFLAWGAGDLVEAEGVAGEARQLFETAGDHRAGLLAARELAWVRGLRGNFAAMEAGGRRVVAAAEAEGERFVIMQGLATIGLATQFQGKFHETDGVLLRALAIAAEDRKVYRLTAIQATLASSLAFQGKVSEAQALMEEAKRLNPDYRDTILVELETQLHWVSGNFRAAVECAREAVAWSPSGTSRRRVGGMALGAAAAVETGDVAQAELFLARARAGLGGRDWSMFAELCSYAEAMLAWHHGRRAECIATLRSAVARCREMKLRVFRGEMLLDVAEVAAESGEAELAAAAVDELDELARYVDCKRYRGLAGIASAWASFVLGDLGRATLTAQAAVEHLAGTGGSATVGRALDVLGRSLSSSDKPTAIRVLDQALSHFDDTGATWRRHRSLEALRRLGGAGRRTAAAVMGAASLSRREREVAMLAAQGQSARQIAQRLFLSERTVETHLSHVYAKLGVRSKLELVHRAADLPL